MFDICPVCQANLALWHTITPLITAVCSPEGTQAGLAALTGPDRLIRSAGTQNSHSQTPHISWLSTVCKCKKHCSPHLFSGTFLLFSGPRFRRSHLSLSGWHRIFLILLQDQMLPAVHHLRSTRCRVLFSS